MANIRVRPAVLADVKEYARLQKVRWREDNKATYTMLLERFRVHPQGMLVAEENGKVVGAVYVMRIATYNYDNPPTWYQVTSDGHCTNHVPDGKIMFGVDLSTQPGIGGRAGDALLMEVGRLAVRERVESVMLGGRMPGYHKYKDQMTADEYLWAKDVEGNFLDQQVRYYTDVPGLRIIKALPNYFHDPDSCDYGVLLRWNNPLYTFPFSHFWAWVFPSLIKVEDWYIWIRRGLRRRYGRRRQKTA